jgi:uncharacterized protein (TIGR02598 family)
LRAFSLIEVTITIGIVVFALMSIFSLISVSMNSSAEASTDTALALATKTICADLSRQSYRAVLYNAKNYTGASPSYYFDSDGRDITTGTTPVTQRVYSCSVKLTTPPLAIYTPETTGTGNLLYFQLNFHRAVGASSQWSRTVVTSVAKYDY